MNYYFIIILFIIFLICVFNIKKTEHLVLTNSDYSNCKIGCLIACRDKHGIHNPECFTDCVNMCWNF